MSSLALPILAENGLSAYIEQINKFPMLDHEEEMRLSRLWHKDQNIEAAHKLVTSHLRLVVKMAMGYRGYGIPISDVISEGNLGLMQAVKKFDPDKGFRLSTYAMWWIRAAINEFILRSWSLVKLGSSASQKKLFFNLRRLKNKIAGVDSRSLTPENISEIADQLNVSETDVVEMDRRLISSDISLNRPMNNEDDQEWIDQVSDPSANQASALEAFNEHNYRMALFREAMKSLSERERDILTARRLQEPPETLDVISQKFDISRERVRQIENKAMEKLEKFVLECVTTS